MEPEQQRPRVEIMPDGSRIIHGKRRVIQSAKFLQERKTGYQEAIKQRRTIRQMLLTVAQEITIEPETGLKMSKQMRMLRKIYQMAMDGNLEAFKALADRVEGKPMQSVVLANGNVGLPIPGDSDELIEGRFKGIQVIFGVPPELEQSYQEQRQNQEAQPQPPAMLDVTPPRPEPTASDPPPAGTFALTLPDEFV